MPLSSKIILFKCKLLENLKVNGDKNSEEEIRKACKKAHIWSSINKSENKLNEIIEIEELLSGGAVLKTKHCKSNFKGCADFNPR